MNFQTQNKSHVTVIRIMFFISQILYQSTDYFEKGSDKILDFWPTELIASLPFKFGSFVMLVLVGITAVGWFEFFVLHKASYGLFMLENLLFPFSYFFLPEKSEIAQSEYSSIIFRLIPLTIITCSTIIKIVFVHIYYSDESYNEFATSNIYFRLFRVLRITFIAVLGYFIGQNALLYFIIAFTFFNTIYKWNTLIYYFPEAELCSTVTDLWGWISTLKFMLKINEFHFSVLNISILFLAYLYFFPHTKPLVVLEKKVDRLLNKMRVCGNNDYWVYLCIYYASTSQSLSPRLLTSQWSSKFKFTIETKMTDPVYKDGNELDHLGKEVSKIECLSGVENVGYGKGKGCISVIEWYVREKGFLDRNSGYRLDSLMFMCYFLVEIECDKFISIYEIYYNMLSLHNSHNFDSIKRRCVNILFELIGSKMKARKYVGTYIEYILKYDSFNSYFESFSKNEQKFVLLIMGKNIWLSEYRNYLEVKIKLKKQMKRELELIEFNFPNATALNLKNYIVDRFVDNNEFLSQEKLMYKMTKEDSRKTKILNFSRSVTDKSKMIFLSDFMKNKGLITHYNKNFQEKLEITKENCLRVKDLIPENWQSAHEEKMVLMDLNDCYEHEKTKSYFINIPNTNRIAEATQLRVLPYCELNSQILLLTEMKIDTNKDIRIFPFDEYNEKSAYFGTRKEMPVKHELFEDEEENTIDETERVIETFGKKYIIKSTEECFNFQTKNLLESAPSEFLEGIDAFIKLGLTNKNQQKNSLEKLKDKVNIFKQEKVSFLPKIWAFCLLFGLSITFLGEFYKSYGSVIRKGMILELKTRKVNLQIFDFESVLLKASKNIPFDTSSSRIGLIFVEDAVELIKQLELYQQYIESLVVYKTFHQSLFSNHLVQLNSNEIEVNFIQTVQNYGILLKSTNKLVEESNYDSWMFGHLLSVIESIKSQQRSSDYILNKVIKESNNRLLEKIYDYNVVYWIAFVLMVICCCVTFYLLKKLRDKLESVFVKPLLMTDSELIAFKNNWKEIIHYAENKEHSNNPIARNESKFNIADNKSVFVTLQLESSNFGFDKEEKVFVGSFFKLQFLLIPLAFVVFCFVIPQITMTFDRIDTSNKLKEFERFTYFNTDLLTMFDDLLKIILRKNFTVNEREQKVTEVILKLNQLSKTDIVPAIEKMFIDKSQVNYTLFGDPCLESNICQMLNSTIRPYPIELNYFISTFYKVLSYIIHHPTHDETVSALRRPLSTSFLSIRSLVEMNMKIFNKNEKTIQEEIDNQNSWVSILHFSCAGFVIFMILGTYRIMYLSEKFGREIISILPSGAAITSKALEYEVNSIIYRNNFAKHVGFA